LRPLKRLLKLVLIRIRRLAVQRKSPIRPGDLVIIPVLPPWVDQLPEETREVFAFCVGRPFCVSEIDRDGLLVLDVSAEVDPRFGGYGNDIRVEPELVSLVGSSEEPSK
jgi:hypothetical protein